LTGKGNRVRVKLNRPGKATPGGENRRTGDGNCFTVYWEKGWERGQESIEGVHGT